MVKGQTLKKIVSVETIRENTVSTPGGTLRGPSLHWPKMSKQIPMHCLWSMRGVGVVFKSFHQNLLTWWKIYRLLRLLLRSKILHRNWHYNHNGIFNLTEFFQGHNFFKDTLLLNEGIPKALKGKKLRLKIPRVLPSIFELILVLQIWGQNTIGGQYLQNINALIFWYKYLQKINAMPSYFWWKKKVSPLWQITFDS